jgi:hypothetical protein
MINIHNPSGTASPGLDTRLATFGTLAQFRAATPLPDNAQRMIDDAVVRVGLDRLTIVRRLIERGLTKPLPNWLSVLELYWERISRAGHAQRTMTPGKREERDQVDRTGVTYPIYATVDGTSFDQRIILAAERSDVPLDTEHIEQATRNVNEAIEDAAINGGITVGGNTSPGFLDAPNANAVAYVDNEAWDAVGHSGDDILTDVLAMATAAKGDGYFGPYELFYPTDYENKLMQDYVAGYPKTIKARLEELQFGGENLRVEVADKLPDDRTILFQATSNVTDVIDGQQPTAVQWQPDPFTFEILVIGCQIVRVKDDYDGKSGIVTGDLTV